MRNTLLAFLALIFSVPAVAQSAAPPAATFEAADVRVSTLSMVQYTVPGALHGDHYSIWNATVIDLIVAAYGVDADTVYGGPSWLENDRFDVLAKTPPGTTPDQLKLMLRAMLTERFHLAVHPDTKPMLTFILSVGKTKPKLREAAAGGETGCKVAPGVTSSLPYVPFQCRSITMDDFAKTLPQIGGSYLTHPVVNSTGLQGSWDFELHWTNLRLLSQSGSEGMTLFDALDKQLGLELQLQKAPRAVLVVDSVDETPTENSAAVAKALPTPPPAEYEVAVIKPSLPNEPIRYITNVPGQIELDNMPLSYLILFAWSSFDDGIPQNLPKWMDSEHFDIIAKTSPEAAQDPRRTQMGDMQRMLKKLLVDRFQMVVHTDMQPVDAWVLTADKPKLEKADPSVRSACKEGPGADGKDPRFANPVLARLVTCQNTTMAQLAERIPNLAAGYFRPPILDATGIEGAYTFTLNFSPPLPPAAANATGGASTSAGAVTTASEPTGAISFVDCLSKQLGLKLEQKKRPMRVLVIDHIEQKPTDN
jgi:uncharacterized protein (TIGR03435 family)